METLQFSIHIDAPRRKVWEVLWGDQTYPQWTRVFSEGSSAVTDWQEGSKVHFLNGAGDGMYSIIERRVANEVMSFRHIGEIKNGVEQPVDEQTQQWGDAVERYTLHEREGGTELTVDLDTTGEFKDYFSEIFPKALNELKRLAETA